MDISWGSSAAATKGGDAAKVSARARSASWSRGLTLLEPLGLIITGFDGNRGVDVSRHFAMAS